MYKIKDGKKQEIRSYITNRKIAKITGYCENYISQIMNGRLASKKVAKAIISTIPNDSKIEDFFEIKY